MQPFRVPSLAPALGGLFAAATAWLTSSAPLQGCAAQRAFYGLEPLNVLWNVAFAIPLCNALVGYLVPMVLAAIAWRGPAQLFWRCSSVSEARARIGQFQHPFPNGLSCYSSGTG